MTGRSPVLAAVLSFFVPGLGQMYAGRVLRGFIIAIPQFVVLGLLVSIYLEHGSAYLAGWLGVNALAVAVVNLLMLVYRAFAVVDAYLVARGGRAVSSRDRRWTALGAIVLAVLLVATVGTHGVAAYFSYETYQFTTETFDRCDDPNADLRPRDCDVATATPTPAPTPTPTLGPTPSGQTPGPSVPPASPTVSPEPGATATAAPTQIVQTDSYWADNGRLDILILGGDAAPGRFDYDPDAKVARQRFDAIHVSSVDLTTGRSALVSLPRYIQFPPLPPEIDLWRCDCFKAYDGYLNALFAYFWDYPDQYPGEGSRVAKGFRALESSVELILGIEIDAIVMVDINGLVEVVDALGGIVINVPEPVVDSGHANEQGVREPINIRAGWQHMDGHVALQYVRSREQDSDIARISRQQIFLRAVRRQMTTCSAQILTRLPDLLRAMGDSVHTDLPLEDVPTLLELLTKTKKPRQIEVHSDNGFERDLSRPGQLELYRAAMAAAFTARPGDDTEEPEEAPPPRFGQGC
jgi:LCP family protein required for cell wall assembly